MIPSVIDYKYATEHGKGNCNENANNIRSLKQLNIEDATTGVYLKAFSKNLVSNSCLAFLKLPLCKKFVPSPVLNLPFLDLAFNVGIVGLHNTTLLLLPQRPQ